MTLTISSSAFREGDKIPRKNTCEGEDISPELTWNKPPEDTMSLALLVDDPDAPGGVFTHWVLFNLRANAVMLPQGVPTQGHLPDGSMQGKRWIRQDWIWWTLPTTGSSSSVSIYYLCTGSVFEFEAWCRQEANRRCNARSHFVTRPDNRNLSTLT